MQYSYCDHRNFDSVNQPLHTHQELYRIAGQYNQATCAFVHLGLAIHPFDNYVTTTLFSTSDHLEWKGFQVFFSWAMHGEAEQPSSTHARKFILTNKCGNKL